MAMVLPAARVKAECENVLGVHDKVLLIPGSSPMGVYPQPDGSTSTWQQGDGPTPPAHPPPASSSCTTSKSAELDAAPAVVSTNTTTSAPSHSCSRPHTETATP